MGDVTARTIRTLQLGYAILCSSGFGAKPRYDKLSFVASGSERHTFVLSSENGTIEYGDGKPNDP